MLKRIVLVLLLGASTWATTIVIGDLVLSTTSSNTAVLRLQLEATDDLGGEWTNVGEPVRWEIPLEGTKFFRVTARGENQMADANGIIFKNPTLNTWFVGPSVDVTAWNVVTVFDSSVSAINGEYTYNSSNNRWENGIARIEKISVSVREGESEITTYRWSLTYLTNVFLAPDNGLNIPPSSFGSTAYPLYLTVSDGVPSGLNGRYTVSSIESYAGTPIWTLDSNPDNALIQAVRSGAFSFNAWSIFYQINFPTDYYSLQNNDVSGIFPETGWYFTYGTGTAPTVSYSMEDIVGGGDTITVSPTSSTATWASTNPTSGFVSLTDTLTADFGYVITFDVQQGVAYPYYKYCTKTAGEVYGTLPDTTRNNYIFAGWYTAPDGQGTQILATTELVADEDATLYAKWVSYVSGKVGCGACLVSLFVLGIGTDLFCEYIGSRLAKTTPQTIIRKLPKP